MMKRFFHLLACCAATMAVCAVTLSAKVTLPSVIGDNMVLQQQSDAALWGTTSHPGAVVRITPSWDGRTVKVKADTDGRWSLKLATPQAGGPYTVRIDDGEALTLTNVLIGEVWLCSGQSNMEMPVIGFHGQRVEGSADILMEASPSVPIRIFKVGREISMTPLQECKGEWNLNDPEAVSNTSAVAYFFARQLQRSLDVPVGIIVTSWGGTRIESWMDRQTLETSFPEVSLKALDDDSEKNQHVPSALYNAMVNPLVPFTVKGLIWYQGESNRLSPDLYARLQPAYVDMMRRKWDNAQMPFYFVQIAPYSYGDVNSDSASRLMEAQARTLDTIPHSGMAPTLDIGDVYCIHPAAKIPVARRLAAMALAHDYGMKLIDVDAPRLRKAEFSDGKARLTFNSATRGIGPAGRRLEGFEIAGEDKVFHPAVATVVKGSFIEVSSREVPSPVAVRYAFHNGSGASVFNAMGIPVCPFRTDDWD